MTLSEFIKKLQAIEAQGHGDLTLKIADWNEGYSPPNEDAANDIEIRQNAVVIG